MVTNANANFLNIFILSPFPQKILPAEKCIHMPIYDALLELNYDYGVKITRVLSFQVTISIKKLRAYSSKACNFYSCSSM
jgi:hypothetical protein